MAWLSPRTACTLAQAAVVLATGAGIALAVAGPGHRWGWWGSRVALGALKWTLLAALLAAVLGAIALVAGLGGAGRAAILGGAAALAIAAATLALPVRMLSAARTVPRIHDITTDTERPPAFVAVLPRRGDAMNPADYPGPDVAAKQRAGYPDLAPAELTVPPARAVAAATDTARALGWEIVAELPADGRLEATDTTPWWGFKDDIVVRIAPRGSGSIVDVRSKSRVGVSDLGVNANRIRRFLSELRSRAS
jgi:uncharacterized protein (DUF1499 family)